MPGLLDDARARRAAHREHRSSDCRLQRARTHPPQRRSGGAARRTHHRLLARETNTENLHDVAILAVSRADVAHLNALVRAALIAQGKLGATPPHIRADDADLVAGDDSREMRTGDLVLIGRNDKQIGLYNGTRAVVTASTSRRTR